MEDFLDKKILKKVKWVEMTDLTHIILALVAVGGFVFVASVAPNVLQVVNLYQKWQKTYKRRNYVNGRLESLITLNYKTPLPLDFSPTTNNRNVLRSSQIKFFLKQFSQFSTESQTLAVSKHNSRDNHQLIAVKKFPDHKTFLDCGSLAQSTSEYCRV